MSRMFDLSNYAVDNVSDEEKQNYVGNMRENGTYRGYKPRKFWVSGVNPLKPGRDSSFTSTLQGVFAIKLNNTTVWTFSVHRGTDLTLTITNSQ